MDTMEHDLNSDNYILADNTSVAEGLPQWHRPDLGVLPSIPSFCAAVVSLGRMCRERGDGKLRLAKEIEEELELLCDAIDAEDRAVICRAVEKITFSNYESRVETSLSPSFSFKYMQNLIGIINQLRKLLGSTACEMELVWHSLLSWPKTNNIQEFPH